MLANYGYKDGSGEFFITIDSDKCNGCGACAKACPYGVLEITEDPNDPFREKPVVVVTEKERKRIKYSCAPCKPVVARSPLPCMVSCELGAISHSW